MSNEEDFAGKMSRGASEGDDKSDTSRRDVPSILQTIPILPKDSQLWATITNNVTGCQALQKAIDRVTDKYTKSSINKKVSKYLKQVNQSLVTIRGYLVKCELIAENVKEYLDIIPIVDKGIVEVTRLRKKALKIRPGSKRWPTTFKARLVAVFGIFAELHEVVAVKL